MKEFLWGTSTSAFQVEGMIENDFTDWESMGKFNSNDKNPKYENGSDHWRQWKKDFDYLKQIGLNSYRLSIEWARIEPQKGEIDENSLEQYIEMVIYLKSLNITPIITLHHFSHPKWFHDFSPWHSEDSIKSFTDFAKLIIDRLNQHVEYWITFNEPQVWALAAYGAKKFPPGIRNLKLMFDALSNMIISHTILYDYIKKADKDAKVGIAKHFIIFKEATNTFWDRSLMKKIHFFFNKMLITSFSSNQIKFNFPLLINYSKYIKIDNKIDFWGINYYYRLHTKFKINLKNPIELLTKNPKTDMGWEIYPKGLKKILKLVNKTKKEIIITENGIATNNEKLRSKFIAKHIKVVTKFAARHKRLRGYLYWSLLDNYEWLEGKDKRFGLLEVDYENNFSRKIKKSALTYSALIKESMR